MTSSSPINVLHPGISSGMDRQDPLNPDGKGKCKLTKMMSCTLSETVIGKKDAIEVGEGASPSPSKPEFYLTITKSLR